MRVGGEEGGKKRRGQREKRVGSSKGKISRRQDALVDLPPERHLHLYRDRARGALRAQRALGGVPQPRARGHHRKCQAPAPARLRVSATLAPPRRRPRPRLPWPRWIPLTRPHVELGGREPWSCGQQARRAGKSGKIEEALAGARVQRALVAPHARAEYGRARAWMSRASPREKRRARERARPRRSQCLPQLPDGGDAGTILTWGGKRTRAPLLQRPVLCEHVDVHTHTGVGAGRSDPTRRRA